MLDFDFLLLLRIVVEDTFGYGHGHRRVFFQGGPPGDFSKIFP